jgi:hypothetical protein
MIGSICQGSLGVCQLGRTWWKTLTCAVGLLDPAYPDNSGGLDAWCLQALELDIDEVYEYLRAELPDYVTLNAGSSGSSARLIGLSRCLPAFAASSRTSRAQTLGDPRIDGLRSLD